MSQRWQINEDPEKHLELFEQNMDPREAITEINGEWDSAG
jgi:hypothetical protein